MDDTKRIGIVGGGQLGRMMALSAHKMGIQVAILDPRGIRSPAGQVVPSELVVEGDLHNHRKIFNLSKMCDIITVETEHVNCDGLEYIVKNFNKTVYPYPDTIRLIQDKYKQKMFLKLHDIPIPEFGLVGSVEDILKWGECYGYPIMLKSRKNSYDGYGNYVVRSCCSAEQGYNKLGGSANELYVERWCPYKKELAVMIAKSISGDIVAYPVVETYHRNNICMFVEYPVDVNDETLTRAMEVAKGVVEKLGSPGIFGVEMFCMQDGGIFVNEVAPRPHNSGHYTIDACIVSQFEMHIRSILGWPLVGNKPFVRSCIMNNVLGGTSIRDTIKPLEKAKMIDGVGIHWYGKGLKPGRKMGHITVCGDTCVDVWDKVWYINDNS